MYAYIQTDVMYTDIYSYMPTLDDKKWYLVDCCLYDFMCTTRDPIPAQTIFLKYVFHFHSYIHFKTPDSDIKFTGIDDVHR